MAREQWQIDQAKECPCGGSDDYCPCQNVNRADATVHVSMTRDDFYNEFKLACGSVREIEGEQVGVITFHNFKAALARAIERERRNGR